MKVCIKFERLEGHLPVLRVSVPHAIPGGGVGRMIGVFTLQWREFRNLERRTGRKFPLGRRIFVPKV